VLGSCLLLEYGTNGSFPSFQCWSPVQAATQHVEGRRGEADTGVPGLCAAPPLTVPTPEASAPVWEIQW
jgi:hypothetical protein